MLNTYSSEDTLFTLGTLTRINIIYCLMTTLCSSEVDCSNIVWLFLIIKKRGLTQEVNQMAPITCFYLKCSDFGDHSFEQLLNDFFLMSLLICATVHGCSIKSHINPARLYEHLLPWSPTSIY